MGWAILKFIWRGEQENVGNARLLCRSRWSPHRLLVNNMMHGKKQGKKVWAFRPFLALDPDTLMMIKSHFPSIIYNDH